MALIHAIYEPFKNQMLHPSSPEPLPSCNPHLLSPSLPASLISCTLPFLHPSFLPLSFPASFQSCIPSICAASHLSCILPLLSSILPVHHPYTILLVLNPPFCIPLVLNLSSPESILSFIPPYLHPSFPAPAFQDTNLEKYGTCEVCQQKK